MLPHKIFWVQKNLTKLDKNAPVQLNYIYYIKAVVLPLCLLSSRFETRNCSYLRNYLMFLGVRVAVSHGTGVSTLSNHRLYVLEV